MYVSDLYKLQATLIKLVHLILWHVEQVWTPVWFSLLPEILKLGNHDENQLGQTIFP